MNYILYYATYSSISISPLSILSFLPPSSSIPQPHPSNLPPSPFPSPTFNHVHPLQSHPPTPHPAAPHNLPFHTSLSNHAHPGNTTPKNTTTTPTASPESSAALNVIVYFPHHPGARFLITRLKRKQVRAQVLKLRPVAGGIQERVLRMRGGLILGRRVVRVVLRFEPEGGLGEGGDRDGDEGWLGEGCGEGRRE